ncbi:MAG: T9SS type A sorting domain-containing protein [Bacteroidota bacterium]|nr:T9SS type A sorting domain-containing protein [Bacteroidota bacterium]MDX5430248.1 T9SS type A sorting domain-containing protein [Bacteroidota bacterium]MDX5469009.1 T9SS type A sorting domain-containing protein [Bacteroidota bacterium]
MKKILLLSLLGILSASVNAQNCTPDATITSPGTYPSILPAGTAGQYYEEVVQFNIPADTQVVLNNAQVTAVIDSIKVRDLQGLPTGLSYGCTPQTCALPGGQTSCGIIYGTIDASISGNYPFIIPVIIYVRIGGAIPFQQPDTIYNLSMEVNAATSSVKVVENALIVYQNPANDRVNVALPYHADNAVLTIYDRQGKKIEIEQVRNYNRIELNTEVLSAGWYVGELRHGNEIHRFHFIRN